MVKFENENDKILAENRKFTEAVSVKNCVNCQLINCDFDAGKTRDGQKVLNATNNKNCKFIKLKFHNKKNAGVVFNLTGAASKDNIVEDCEWFDIESTAANGAEPMRIGNSELSHNFLKTEVRRCKFTGIKTKEPELISIKSCGNLIENNEINSCTCSITVRHGHTNTIRNNQFEGTGGIRIYGKDNKIENNVHRNNKDSKFVPLQVVNGDRKEDPNEAAGIPQGKSADDGHATHTQVIGGHILGNTYENCTRPVKWGRDKDKKFKPSGVKFVENKYIATAVSCTAIEFSGGATSAGNIFQDNKHSGKVTIPESIKDGFAKFDPNQPDPIVVPDPEPEPPEPEEPIPPQPEPEPTVEPGEEPQSHARLCQVGHADEGKVRLAIYVCAKHVDDVKPELIEAMKRIKAKVQSGQIQLVEEE